MNNKNHFQALIKQNNLFFETSSNVEKQLVVKRVRLEHVSTPKTLSECFAKHLKMFNYFGFNKNII